MAQVTWDILLSTIPHRHEELCTLLTVIDSQIVPGFGVRLLRDNLELPGNASYRKWQTLAESSRADYISHMADDDGMAPDFVPRVMEALNKRPDYVGFQVKYTRDGVQAAKVEHSLRHSGWFDTAGWLVRDIVHQNPMRREMSLLATWGSWGTWSEDREWADAIRANPAGPSRVREEFIAEEIFYYQENTRSNWLTPRTPMPEPLPELPSYPWLEVL